MTHLEMDELFKNNDPRLENAEEVVFIQCVGSRNEEHPYCSKVCCTHTIKSALALKKRNPDLNVYVLYRDIRTYGTREDLYRKAREMGVLFFRYSPEHKPVVAPDGNRVTVTFEDRSSADTGSRCGYPLSGHGHRFPPGYKLWPRCSRSPWTGTGGFWRPIRN